MRRNQADSEVLPFHVVSAFPLVAGVQNIATIPGGLSARAGAVADTWAHYRIKKLKFRLHPTEAAGLAQAAGFCGGVQDTQPATILQIGELIPSTVLAGDTTHPTEWVNVPRQDLAGPLPWYKTVAGAADPTEEQPGIICIAGTGTDAVLFEARGVYEFKTSVNTANTPAEMALRAELRAARLARMREVERAKLLTVLSPGPSKSTQTLVLPSGRVVVQV